MAGGGGGDIAESGIGGTGIIGTITGFGSICVNGLEVSFDEETPVEFDGHSGSAASLKVGHLVFVEARGVGQQLAATRISMRSEVRGPVTSVDPATGRIYMLGQTVLADHRTAFPDNSTTTLDEALQSIQPGARVRVSGLRHPDGVIQATRIEAAPDRDDIGLSGWVSGVRAGVVSVNGFPVELADPQLAEGLGEDNRVTLCGTMTPQGLLATEFHLQPSLPFRGRLGLLDLEGFIEELSEQGVLRLWGQPVHVSETTRFLGGEPGQLTPGQRVQVRARLGAGDRLEAERVAFLSGT
jgi:hypothetical protein